MKDVSNSAQCSLLRLQHHACMLTGDTWSSADPLHMTLQLPCVVREWSEPQLSLPVR